MIRYYDINNLDFSSYSSVARSVLTIVYAFATIRFI